MRYAIVESGGKQYRAVEGGKIEVDRLSAEKGDKINIDRVLLMADGDEYLVGAPALGEILVKATVVDHFRGEKVFRFKYSPKKRIRVRGGHRQQYTRLMVDFIGREGEVRKIEQAEPEKKAEVKVEKVKAEPKPKAEKPVASPAKEAAKKIEKTPAKKTEKAPARKSTSTKPATTKKSSTTTKKSSSK
ncbi:MAG: 50S ribosomal protein L21 [Chloroflexi bacterium]|nr:50S ribosomal protein L21 [Chloroflexota bacterium]